MGVLKLKKIELVGFKSFCDRTTLELAGSGITCIVGPNGCGKSNIVDAISWVLGEQSTKNLRAERMADCISNGSATRAPMGMAEVSLTLVDPELAEAAEKILLNTGAGQACLQENSAASEAVSESADTSDGATARTSAPEHPKSSQLETPSEVVVTRRLYRSGQSEYLINGRQVRLRDIQELFMGIGLGPNSYAIIEQGRIGHILSSRPAERRAILEEAAGISKYKAKRRLAEARLQAARQNLARVNDILNEVTHQLQSLRRQASRARRYRELREQLQQALTTVLVARWRRLRDLLADRDQQSRVLGEMQSQLIEALAAAESEQQAAEAEATRLETALRHLHNQMGMATLEAERQRGRLASNAREAEQVVTRLAEVNARLEELANTLESLAAQERNLAAAAEQLRAERAREEEQVRALTEEVQELDRQLTAAQQLRATRTAEFEALSDRIAAARATAAQADEAARHVAAALEAARAAAGRLEREHKQKETSLHGLERQLAATRESVAQFRRQLAELQNTCQAARTARANALDELTRAREELAAAEERRHTLTRVLEERVYAASTVQKLLSLDGQGSRSGFRPRGLLADFAEVDPGYENAVEQFLHEELHYVVVENFESARAGLTLVCDAVGGRATFFMDSISVSGSPQHPQHALETRPPVLARLDRLVHFRAPLSNGLKRFLPRLASAYLVETLEAAQQLAQQYPDLYFLTPEGAWVHGRLVSGGRPGEAGPLALKRELRETERLCEERQREVEYQQLLAAQLDSQVTVLEAELEHVRTHLLLEEKQLGTLTQEFERARAEWQRQAQQHKQQQGEIARLETQLAALQKQQQQAAAEQARAEQHRRELEQSLPDLDRRIASLGEALKVGREYLTAARVRLAACSERLAALEQNHARLMTELTERQQQQQALQSQRETLGHRLRELEKDSAAAREVLERAQEAITRLTEEISSQEQALQQAREHALQAAEHARGERQRLDQLREQRARLDIEQTRLQADLEHLAQASQNELGTTIAELLQTQTGSLGEEELAAAETSCQELRERLEALGPVNPLALEEFAECEQRATFLTRERDDLVRSITDTEQAIAELDAASHKRFREAFEAINRHFAEAFRVLFGGGAAEMRLTEPDSAGEPGLEMIVQPPGKRLQNVILLSGGEKALAALALLIAIFRYQPSPFCVLDEVDAPLDESNIGRFLEMLREMGEQIQFIVVTHNRRTMEAASVLYGVTMQEPGVSQIVSVRFEHRGTHAA
jgi:chromosome segregation protein